MENFGTHITIPKRTGITKSMPYTAAAFFLSSNQAWAKPNWSDWEKNLFRKTLQASPNLSSNQIVVHGCYLINPASEREDVREKSLTRFIQEVELCDELNIGRYVFHPGSTRGPIQTGLDQTVELVKQGLEKTEKVNILIENMTKSNSLGQTWQEIDWIVRHVGDPRVGVCLDTAHAWGAGDTKGMHMDTLLDDMDRVIGIDWLKAVHLNDSKVAYGANRDRHENIFKGKIPHEFFKKFIFDARVKSIPTILETPNDCFGILKLFIETGGEMELMKELGVAGLDYSEEIVD